MKKNVSKILVTGGAGFIGSHIVDKLLAMNYEVTILDNISTGSLDNIAHHRENDNFRFEEGDIRNVDLIEKCVEDQDVVFHEAAITNIAYSVQHPVITHEVNITGTLQLLQACLKADVKRFIFASSASVYGDKNVSPLKENMRLYPKSPYAITKITGEYYAKTYFELYGIDTICLRYFNVYGPRAGPQKGVISIFMNELISNNSPIIYGDGEQTRDFIYVEDVVQANLLALHSKHAIGETYNIGTGTPVSLNTLVNLLQKTTGKENINPSYASPRQGDVKHGFCDNSKARNNLNFHLKTSFKKGIAQLYNWYLMKNRSR